MASMAVTELVAKMGLDASEFEKGLLNAQVALANTIRNITNSISGPLSAALDDFNSSGAALVPTVELEDVDRSVDGIGKVGQELDKTARKTEEVDKALKKIGQSFDRVPQRASNGLGRLQSMMSQSVGNLTKMISGPLTMAFGALMSGAALNQYINQADSIGKLADSIGIDIEALQAWGEAAERAGGSASGFQQTVKGLNQRLQEVARGGGNEIKATLDSFGIAATDASGKARDTLDVLMDLSEKSEGMDKQKFVGLAQKLGIDSGTIMLLQSGRLALDDLIKRQKALGVYTKEDADVASKAKDAMSDLQQVLKAFAAILGRVIVPVITFMTEKLTAFVVYIKDHKEFVLTTILVIGAAITATMIPALTRMAIAAWAAMAPFLPFIAAAVALGLVIDDLCGYINGADSELADFWALFGTGPELAEKFSKAWSWMKENLSWEGVKNNTKAAWQWIKTTVENTVKDFAVIWDGISGGFDKVCADISNAFTPIIENVKGGFSQAIEGIKSWFSAAWAFVWGMAVDYLINPLLSLFGTTWDEVSKQLEGAFDSAIEYIFSAFSKMFNEIKKMVMKAIQPIVDLWNKVTGGGEMGEQTKKVVEHFKNISEDDHDQIAEDNTIDLREKGIPIKPVGGSTAAGGSLPGSVVNNESKTDIKQEFHQELNVSKIEVTAPDAQAAAEAVRSDLQTKGSLAFRTETGTRM